MRRSFWQPTSSGPNGPFPVVNNRLLRLFELATSRCAIDVLSNLRCNLQIYEFLTLFKFMSVRGDLLVLQSVHVKIKTRKHPVTSDHLESHYQEFWYKRNRPRPQKYLLKLVYYTDIVRLVDLF